MRNNGAQFSFLRGSIKILIADNTFLFDRLREYFQGFDLFEFHGAPSLERTYSALACDGCHLIVYNADLSSNEYAAAELLSSTDIPTIVFCEPFSTLKASLFMSFGAFWILDATLQLNNRFFFSVLRNKLLNLIFASQANGSPDRELSRAIKMLITQKPDNIRQWAEMIHGCERTLRRIICRNYDLHANQLIKLFHILDTAYSFFWYNTPSLFSSVPSGIKTNGHNDKYEEFYYFHKMKISKMLSARKIAFRNRCSAILTKTELQKV